MRWEVEVKEGTPFPLKPGRYAIELRDGKLALSFRDDHCEEERVIEVTGGRARIAARRSYTRAHSEEWAVEVDGPPLSRISQLTDQGYLCRLVGMYGVDGAFEFILSVIRSALEEVLRLAPPLLADVEYAA